MYRFCDSNPRVRGKVCSRRNSDHCGKFCKSISGPGTMFCPSIDLVAENCNRCQQGDEDQDPEN